MNKPKNNFQTQINDTVKTNDVIANNAQLNSNNLKVERKNIEISDIKKISTDSLRPKKTIKYRKPINVICEIPQNDSIEHPQYSSLTNTFKFPENFSFFDQINTNPIPPILEIEKQKIAEPAKNLKAEKNIWEVKPNKENLIVEKLNNQHTFEKTDWMLAVIIIAWTIFVWLRVGFGKFFQAAIQASYNYFAARRISEESNKFQSLVFSFMNSLFFINLSLFITQYIDYYNYNIFNLEYYILFFIILASLIIIYGFKYLFFKLLDFFFLTKGAFSSYNATIFIYNRIIGFILLLPISTLPYLPQYIAPFIFKITIAIILISYIFRLFRGILTGIKIRVSIFYLFLYLCTLEILPILMLYKTIKMLV